MIYIVERLRNWRGVHLAHYGQLFEAAADEIERLRGDAEVSRLRLDAAHAEIERLRQSDRSQPITPAEDTPATHATLDEGTVQAECTLTAEERQAIMASQGFWALEDSPHADTLRNLLERLA